MTIETLIDKTDSAEVVRTQIALILATESANQQVLAVAASQDPALYALRVYEERSNPWEAYLNNPGDQDFDSTPVVNVWWDSSAFDMAASNSIERQKSSAIYNIDCYGFGLSADNPAGGHTPGDRAAALAAHRAVRLSRNILMAAENTYLGLRGQVWKRWVNSINIFQPQQEEHRVQHVVGARIAFRVEFNEFSPQVPAEELCFLAVDVNRAEDGQLIVEADYDYENVDF